MKKGYTYNYNSLYWQVAPSPPIAAFSGKLSAFIPAVIQTLLAFNLAQLAPSHVCKFSQSLLM